MVTIKYIFTDGLSWERVKRLPSLLPVDVETADRQKHLPDKILHLLSAYLKRKYIGSWTKNESGKPLSKNAFFNVSHCEGMVVIALSDRNVGVDAERIRTTDEDLRAYVSSPEEKAFMSTDEDFFSVWTAKESLVKAEGSGLPNKPNKIPAFPLNGIKCFNDISYFTRQIRIDDFVLSVTREGIEPFVPKIEKEELP